MTAPSSPVPGKRSLLERIATLEAQVQFARDINFLSAYEHRLRQEAGEVARLRDVLWDKFTDGASPDEARLRLQSIALSVQRREAEARSPQLRSTDPVAPDPDGVG
jgi:hypothetical protein